MEVAMNRHNTDQWSMHERLQSMLPWYVNGTLDERDRAEVHAHLQNCTDCRAETELHACIMERVREGRDVHPAAVGSLNVLMERIEAHDASLRRRLVRWCRERLEGRPMECALTAQAATILLLVLMLAWMVTRPEPPAEYRTLASPAAMQTDRGPQLLLELHRSLTAAEVQRLLQQVGGQIVHGPSAQGAYIVELAGADAADSRTVSEIAAWLRAQPGVEQVSSLAPAEPD
jgi:anti-sigma factor RsiW